MDRITANCLNVGENIELRPLLDRLQRLQHSGNTRSIIAVCRIQREKNLDRLTIAGTLPDGILTFTTFLLTPASRLQINRHILRTNSA
jgi:hypothetical protein